MCRKWEFIEAGVLLLRQDMFFVACAWSQLWSVSRSSTWSELTIGFQQAENTTQRHVDPIGAIVKLVA
jgi:hypothetical protein